MDPLALLPYALAAAGGRLGAYEVSALVAAGITLLQRSAPLVRALSGRRSAVLLPPGPAWVVALAASDGRAMVVLDHDAAASAGIAAGEDIGAVFTLDRYRDRIPAGLPVIALDEAPRRAHVVVHDRQQAIDLGSHFALDLAGDANGHGSMEPCLQFGLDGDVLTHAAIMHQARAWLQRAPFTTVDRTLTVVNALTPDMLAAGLVAPLLVGGIVHTIHDADEARLVRAAHEFDATMLVLSPVFESLLIGEHATMSSAGARFKAIVRPGRD